MTTTAPPATKGKVPLRGQARFAFTVLFIINVLNYADRYVLPAILPKVQKELGLTLVEQGLLGSSFIFVFALATLPLGVWADKTVRKNIIALCVAIWSLTTTLGGLARSFLQLLAIRAALGIGEAGYGPASISLLGDYFHKAQRGRILSYWSVGNLIGAALGFTIASLIADTFGWRWSFYVVGIPGLIVAVLAWRIFEPERGAVDREENDTVEEKTISEASMAHGGISRDFWSTGKKLFHIPTYWILLSALTFSFFTIGGTSFWLPTYFVNTFSLKVSQAGSISGAVLVGSGLIGTVVGGWLADLLQRYRPEGRMFVTMLGFLIAAPVVLLALFTYNLSLFVALFAIVGISLSFCTGPLFAILQDTIVPHMRATAIGLALLIAHMLGDAAAPSIIGLIAGASTLGWALVITTPLSLFLAGFSCLVGLRTVARDMRHMQEQVRK